VLKNEVAILEGWLFGLRRLAATVKGKQQQKRKGKLTHN
jgi:hypothetical protein